MSQNDSQILEQVNEALKSDATATAIQILFEAYGSRLERLISVRLDPRVAARVDAADVLQEAFVEISEKIPSYQESSQLPLYLWLRTIVLERVIATHRTHLVTQKRDVRREAKRHRAENSFDSAMSLANLLLGDDTSVSRKAIRTERHQVLAEALEQLSSSDHEIVLLRIYEDLTNQEVGEILGIDSRAASKRFIRAIQRLGNLLRSLPDFETTSGFFKHD